MFTIELKEDEISAALARPSHALGDMTEVMQDIGEYLVESTKRRFESGAAPDGTPWAAKSPTTIDAYERRGDRVDFRPLFGPSVHRSFRYRSDSGSGYRVGMAGRRGFVRQVTARRLIPARAGNGLSTASTIRAADTQPWAGKAPWHASWE